MWCAACSPKYAIWSELIIVLAHATDQQLTVEDKGMIFDPRIELNDASESHLFTPSPDYGK